MKTMSPLFFQKAEAQTPNKKTNPIPKKETFPMPNSDGSREIVSPENIKPILTIDHIPASFPHPALVKLFFSTKPEKPTREALKMHNFWYHPSDFGWSHIDTPECRKWLNEYFSAELEIDQAPEYNDNKPVLEENKTSINALGRDLEPTPLPLPSLEIVVLPESTLERYHRQIDRLTQHLKCSVSDLAFIAVDKLYQCEFPG